METTLISIVIGLFVAILFLNVFFRVQIFKIYKRLVDNEVEFEPKHVFNTKKMQEEVIPKYPDQEQDILDFSKKVKQSIHIATVLLLLIILVGRLISKG